jgi:hypothetical protein
MTPSRPLKNKILVSLGASILAIPVGFLGCSGGGGSGGGGTTGAAEITSATVEEALTWIEDTVPGCTVVNSQASAAQKAAAQATGALGEVLALIRDARKLPTGRATELAAQTFAGDCGGTLMVDSVHLNGVTTYTMNFSNFCSTDTSVTPPQQSMATGTVVAKEIGTPSASGPIISSGSLETDELTLVTGSETMKLVLNNATVTYGVPGTWSPGIPTQQNPNQLTIDQVTVNLQSQDRVHTLTNVSATGYESGANDVVNISGGRYSTTNHGHVNISTSSPLLVNIDTGQIMGGTLTFTGANGGVAEVTAAGDGSATGTITVNGTALGSGLDCSGTQGLLLGLM